MIKKTANKVFFLSLKQNNKGLLYYFYTPAADFVSNYLRGNIQYTSDYLEITERGLLCSFGNKNQVCFLLHAKKLIFEVFYMNYEVKFTSSADDYGMVISKLSRMLQDSGFVLIKNTRGTNCYNTNYRNVEQVMGDLKLSELREYQNLIDKVINNN